MKHVQVLDFALQMEKDGEAFYRQCAAGTADKGVAAILTRLADAEVTHMKVLRAIKEERKTDLPKAVIRADVKNIFAKMLAAGDRFGGEKSELDLYKRALEMEVKNRDFYTANAAVMEPSGGRDLFMRIAAEEQMHVDFVQGIVDFVSRTEPGNWLEDAEWYHTEEY